MRNSMKMSILGNFAAIFLAAILFIGLALSQIAEAGVATIKNVRITNVRGTQFSVSWTGDASEIGYVRYKDSLAGNDSWQNAFDDRGVSTSDDIHHVTVKGLTPVYDVYKRNTSGDLVDSAGNLLKANDSDTNIVVESAVTPVYYFKIISGTAVDDNESHYYRVDPGPAIVQAGSCQPAGKVYMDQAMTPVADAIAYATILGASESQNSATESMVVNNDSPIKGRWFFDLVNFRTKDSYDKYAYGCNDSNISIEIQGGGLGTAQMITRAIDYGTAQNEREALTVAATTDVTAPGPVSNLQAAAADRSASLTWTNPTDSDLAGVLIIYRQGAAPTGVPTAGINYNVGVAIGDGTVGFIGSGASATINNLAATQTYYFAVFAFDGRPNYSTAVTANATPWQVDTDSDGMPDWWEDLYTGLNKSDNDASGDLDADGYSNLNEYLNTTNPIVDDPAYALNGYSSTTDTRGPYQIVYSNSSALKALPGNSFSMGLMYDTSDQDTTLSGIGVRIHYDSSKIQFVDVTNLFENGSIATPSDNQETLQESDGDDATDRFVLIGWAVTNSNWPNQNLPLACATINFIAKSSLQAGASSFIRFSSSSKDVSHIFASIPVKFEAQSFSLDIDGSGGNPDALSDGLLILRYMFGFRGDSLTTGVVNPSGTRTSATEIAAYIQSNYNLLDIDGSGGNPDALSDGLLILRYMFGFRGDSLITGVVNPGGTRTSATEIATYIQQLFP